MDVVGVLVVDDVEAVRTGLALHLGAEPWLRVLGAAADGAAVAAAVTALGPDVVVMDVEMPGLDGVTATRRLRAAGVEVPVVLMSVHADRVVTAEALAAGAQALVCKCDGPGALLRALRAATGRAVRAGA
jgi:DNA-binding NarL/FixJ family response regulator